MHRCVRMGKYALDTAMGIAEPLSRRQTTIANIRPGALHVAELSLPQI